MDNILEMRGITKIFPGVVALDHVDFDLRPGEVHVLLGENGAGKSTLIKILAGAYVPTSGTITIEGKTAVISRPKDALELGVRIIYQELMVNDYITVTENIFQGRELKKRGLIDWKEMHRQAGEILAEMNYDLDPHAQVGTLGIAKKQIVEIVKAISNQCKMIVFDEPTASLSPREIETLFTIIRKLKARGLGIVYISHRMPELYEIGDRVTVLRDGKKIETREIAEVTPEDLVTMVSGKKVEERAKECYATDQIVLEARNMPTVLNKDEGISFHLRKGEILGIAGIEGNGQTELIEVLTGLRRPDHMELFKDGKPLSGNAAAFLAVATLSGGALGDSYSPISSSNITVAFTQDADIQKITRTRAPLVFTAAAISAIVFACFGGGGTVSTPPQFAASMSPTCLLLLLAFGIVIVASLLGRHIIESLTWGIAAAIVIGLAIGRLSLSDLLHPVTTGGMSSGLLENGVSGVTGVIIFILFILGVIQLVMESGIMEDIVNWVQKTFIKTARQAEITIIASTVLITIPISANVPAEVLLGTTFVKPLSQRFGIAPERAADLLCCSACTIFYMLPWHIVCALWFNTVSHAAAEYGLVSPPITSALLMPYAWALLLVLFLSAITGWQKRIPTQGLSSKEQNDAVSR